MDTFMEKLAQKFTAQEMIRANAAAEAAELQRTRDQVKQYNDCLQEMKQVNNETREALAQMEQALAIGVEQFKNAKIPTEGFEQLVENSMCRIMELQQNAQEIQESIKTHLDSVSGEITEFVHKENVKVYRNVQAVVVEELKKQSEELDEKLYVLSRKQSSVMKVASAAMVFALLSAAALTVQLLIQFGII